MPAFYPHCKSKVAGLFLEPAIFICVDLAVKRFMRDPICILLPVDNRIQAVCEYLHRVAVIDGYVSVLSALCCPRGGYAADFCRIDALRGLHQRPALFGGNPRAKRQRLYYRKPDGRSLWRPRRRLYGGCRPF